MVCLISYSQLSVSHSLSGDRPLNRVSPVHDICQRVAVRPLTWSNGGFYSRESGKDGYGLPHDSESLIFWFTDVTVGAFMSDSVVLLR